MNKINTWALALAGAATIGLGGVATAVLAADQPAPPAATQGGPERPRWDSAQMQARMAERAERRAAHLRDVLQLRQDQEPALQALMSSMRPPEGMRRGMGGMGRGGPGGGMGPGGMGRGGMGADEHLTTPQRLDRMAEMMTRHQQAFQARSEAIRRFYAQLSPAQQRAFDALPPMGGHGGMGGGRGGHRGFGGHGMGGRHMGGPGMDGPGPGGPPPGDDGQ